MKTYYSHLADWPLGGMERLFSTQYGLTQVGTPAEADVIIWNGGEDIGTSIYNERPCMSGIPLQASKRDTAEIAMWNEFKSRPNKLLLGVCRGSQLLNCLNGGSLWQHVDGHNGSHEMVDLRSGEVVAVTSTHHQQMIPPEKEGVVIGVASKSTIKMRDGHRKAHVPTSNLRDGLDVEIMWYPRTHTLCIQGHPEYVPNSRFASYTKELLDACWAEMKIVANGRAA